MNKLIGREIGKFQKNNVTNKKLYGNMKNQIITSQMETKL